MKGSILFGHGSRSVEWAKPFHALRDLLATRVPQMPVALGFLEIMRPTLDEAIDELVQRGVDEINVVPIFLATGGHVAKDLPLLAATAMDRHPGIAITIAAPVGESALVIDAMANYVLEHFQP